MGISVWMDSWCSGQYECACSCGFGRRDGSSANCTQGASREEDSVGHSTIHAWWMVSCTCSMIERNICLTNQQVRGLDLRGAAMILLVPFHAFYGVHERWKPGYTGGLILIPGEALDSKVGLTQRHPSSRFINSVPEANDFRSNRTLSSSDRER